jgi:ferric-dicitrate binding protein FerR (iron transport regulator)
VTACPACADAERKLIRVWALMGAFGNPASARPQPPVVHSPFRRWKLVAAAAVVVAVAGILLRPSAPVAPSPAPVAVQSAPEEPREVQAEKERVESTLARIEPPAPQQPPAPAPVEPPALPAEPVKPLLKAADPVTPRPVAAPAVVEPPKPAPKPAPADTTPPVVKPAAAVAARLDEFAGEVAVLVDGVRVAAKPGLDLPAGAALETSGKASQAVLTFADGTRVVLGADTSVSELTHESPKAGEGKRLFVAKGVLASQIARQPAGKSMVFATPLAEARVLGTRLTLSVTPVLTRLEVREGKVRLTRRDDGAGVDVGADQGAAVGRNISLAAKALAPARTALKETFDRSRWSTSWVVGGNAGQGVRMGVEGGSLSFKLSARPPQDLPPGVPLPSGITDQQRRAVEAAGKLSQAGAAKEWSRSVWLESRPVVGWTPEAPLRLRTRLWSSHAESDRAAWIALNRGVAGAGLLLERRGGSLQLWSEGASTPIWKKDLAAAQEWETLELWISKDEMVLRRNDETLYSGPLPARARGGQLSLGASCRSELARDQEIRFDEIEAGWVSPAEFEALSR